jgi:glycosyltransferase involved in cell wall biosynthesis
MHQVATAVLVPMFNEGRVVGPVVAELRSEFSLVICVDDGSDDNSSDVARQAGATVLRHQVNLGQGAALQTGIDYALARTTVQHLVTFDADGQHSVRDAVDMVAAAQATGVDVVLGSRNIGTTVDQPAARRLLLSAALRYSRWSTGLDLTDTHNGLRVLNRRALELFRLRQQGMAYASELEASIVEHGLSWIEHPVTISYSDYSRGKGQNNLNAFNIMYDLMVARLSPST